MLSPRALAHIRGDTATLPIQASEDLSLASVVIWTAKRSYADADADAVCQKAIGIGLSVAGSTISLGLVPVDFSALTAESTRLVWDAQAQWGDGSVRTVATGTITIAADITRSTTTSVPIYTTEAPLPFGEPVGTAAAKVAAHDADPGAHGPAGIYTVAQLAALTAGNRPPIAYCSDCLTPEGVGSPVVWTGVDWASTTSGLIVTTDVLTFFRSVAASGRDFFTPAGTGHKVGKIPYGIQGNATGTGAGINPHYDGDTCSYQAGTSAGSGYAGDSTYFNGYMLTNALGRQAGAIYTAAEIRVAALSTAAAEFAVRFGFLPVGTNGIALGTYGVEFVYDRGNVLGIGNTGNSHNLFTLTREGSVNTVTNTGVQMPVTFAGRVRLECLIDVATARFFVNGAEITVPQMNLPNAAVSRYFCSILAIGKSAGAVDCAVNKTRPYTACRYV